MSVLLQSNFKNSRPLFSADEYPLRLRIVGYSVQHVFVSCSVLPCQNTRHIKERRNLPTSGIDPDDLVCLPHVRPYFTVNVFQFIQSCQWRAVQGHVDLSNGLKSFGIKIKETAAAIAQNQIFAVIGQTPAFCWI